MEVFDFFEKKQTEEIDLQEKCTFSYFGEINIDNLEEYYSVNFQFNNKVITIDLNFQNKKIDKFRIEQIISFLGAIKDYDRLNRVYIEDNFVEDGVVSGFINSYLEEFEQDDLSGIINMDNQIASKNFELLKQLNLIRIGFYPDGKYNVSYFAAFDYSIDDDGDPCDQLLVVNIGEKGKLCAVTWVG